MNRARKMLLNPVARGTVLLAFATFFAVPLHAAEQGAADQRAFATPDAAAAALVQALKARDRAAVLSILGAGASSTAFSGDAVADRNAGERFAAQYAEKHSVAVEGDSRASLLVGAEDVPFSYPLVKTPAGWRFDTAAGNDEVIARRIGRNELAVMNVLLAIVDAQREYASADRDPSGVRAYAMKLASTPGRTDGLYWKTSPGQPESPLGPLVTRAAAEGYTKQASPTPYHGYYFKLLKGQGENAKGGALDYVARGRMIGGFAVVAWPARYANSGVMTFIVNHDGVVYERDLGKDTAALAAAMRRFDPEPGWTQVKAP